MRRCDANLSAVSTIQSDDEEPVAYLGAASDTHQSSDEQERPNNSTSDISDSDSETEEPHEVPTKKLKLQSNNPAIKQQQAESSEESESEEETEASDQKLEDVEAFALKLLQNG